MDNEKKKKGKKILRNILITICGIVVVMVIAYLIYNRHMHYEIEPHESYNVDVMDQEGRT
jgi:hypothetical protein